MRTFYIFLVFCLGSCQASVKDYSFYESRHIKFSSVLSMDEEKYQVYFYSKDCIHCNNIKEEIFNHLDLEQTRLFLVAKSSEIVFKEDVSLTIGVRTIVDFYIFAFPSLVTIVNGIVIQNVFGEKAVLGCLL